MRYETLLYAVAGDVATVTLNRPDRMNCLNTAMRSELLDALTRAPRDARAVILTGAGRGFCAGQDLGDAGNAADLNLERVLREEYEPLLKLVYDCPVPIICAVNGAAASQYAEVDPIWRADSKLLEKFKAAGIEAGFVPRISPTRIIKRGLALCD